MKWECQVWHSGLCENLFNSWKRDEKVMKAELTSAERVQISGIGNLLTNADEICDWAGRFGCIQAALFPSRWKLCVFPLILVLFFTAHPVGLVVQPGGLQQLGCATKLNGCAVKNSLALPGSTGMHWVSTQKGTEHARMHQKWPAQS